MYYLESTGWAWWPISAAALLSAVFFILGLHYNRARPLRLKKTYFEGPAFANASTISTLLAILPILLSDEIRADTVSASLLGVAALLFTVSTFLSLWLYTTVLAKEETNGLITLDSALLVGLQGIIIACMMVAVLCFMTFIFATRVLGGGD